MRWDNVGVFIACLSLIVVASFAGARRVYPATTNAKAEPEYPALLFRPLYLAGTHQFNFVTLKRSALIMTLTEDNDIAAAANIGDKRMPKKG